MEQDPKSSNLALKTVFLVYVTDVTKLVSHRVLGSEPRLRPLFLAEEVAFPLRFPQPITKLMVRMEQHKFYSMTKEWRSESLVHKSTSQPNLGQGKSKEIESREGGIFMTYLRTRV